jgi:hypothetical protein
MAAKQTRRTKTVSKRDNIEENELDVFEREEDDLDGGLQIQPKLVRNFIRMWPRAIFSTPGLTAGRRGKAPAIARTINVLKKPGVYVLYRDDQPFYVGQAKNGLLHRIWAHANGVGSLRTYFWNYFSAFIVEDRKLIDEVEAIVISAMPALLSNASNPRLPRVRMEKPVRDLIRDSRKTRGF